MMRKHLVASIPFYYDRLKICVQKNKPIPLSHTIFTLCNDPIVYGVFFFHAIVVTFVGYFFQMFEKAFKWDLFRISVNGFACYMGMPCTYNPINNAHRVVSISVYFASWLFATLLSTMIVRMFTTPMFNPQVKTIDQLTENEFGLVGNAFVYKEIVEQSQVFSKQILI